jgi:hypothetical protein
VSSFSKIVRAGGTIGLRLPVRQPQIQKLRRKSANSDREEDFGFRDAGQRLGLSTSETLAWIWKPRASFDPGLETAVGVDYTAFRECFRHVDLSRGLKRLGRVSWLAEQMDFLGRRRQEWRNCVPLKSCVGCIRGKVNFVARVKSFNRGDDLSVTIVVEIYSLFDQRHFRSPVLLNMTKRHQLLKARAPAKVRQICIAIETTEGVVGKMLKNIKGFVLLPKSTPGLYEPPGDIH